MSRPFTVFLQGARGRMGQAIAAAAREQGLAVLEADVGLAAELAGADVAVDFSAPAATAPLAWQCVRLGKPLVIGTTGHSEAQRAEILGVTDQIQVVWAGNYSLGVNVLLYLAERAAALLPEEFEAEIIEAHHSKKVDAPSGTALNLLEALRAGRAAHPPAAVFGRQGAAGPRPRREVGVHAVRGGDIVGEHTVLLAGPHERVELVHRASDRRIFALGALHAARWLPGRRPGLYDMRDVLGLR